VRTIEQPAMQEIIASATQVWLPKGSEADTVQRGLNDMGIVVPTLSRDRPEVTTPSGTMYTQARSKDIATLARMDLGPSDADGVVRPIGFMGLDVAEEYIGDDTDGSLEYAAFDTGKEPMCTFELQFLKRDEGFDGTLRERLLDKNLAPLRVVTGLPRLLGRVALERDWNMIAVEYRDYEGEELENYAPGGSTEVIARKAIEAGQADAAADLVTSGRSGEQAGGEDEEGNQKPGFWTSRSSDLPENYPGDTVLREIYPVIVWRNPETKRVPKPEDLNRGIRRIDETLDRRSAQIDDLAVTSYTLERLRNPNEAGKKFGEEACEAMMAIFGNGTTQDCEGEIADVTYAALTAARSENKPARLENILRILMDRNQTMSEKPRS